jgi:hypothetical protein
MRAQSVGGCGGNAGFTVSAALGISKSPASAWPSAATAGRAEGRRGPGDRLPGGHPTAGDRSTASTRRASGAAAAPGLGRPGRERAQRRTAQPADRVQHGRPGRGGRQRRRRDGDERGRDLDPRRRVAGISASVGGWRPRRLQRQRSRRSLLDNPPSRRRSVEARRRRRRLSGHGAPVGSDDLDAGDKSPAASTPRAAGGGNADIAASIAPAKAGHISVAVGGEGGSAEGAPSTSATVRRRIQSPASSPEHQSGRCDAS